VRYILAMGRDVNLNIKDGRGMTPIDYAKEEKEKEQRSKERKSNYTDIIELLESFERNPNETRIKLRIQLGFSGKIFFYFYFYFIFNYFIFNFFHFISISFKF